MITVVSSKTSRTIVNTQAALTEILAKNPDALVVCVRGGIARLLVESKHGNGAFVHLSESTINWHYSVQRAIDSEIENGNTVMIFESIGELVRFLKGDAKLYGHPNESSSI